MILSNFERHDVGKKTKKDANKNMKRKNGIKQWADASLLMLRSVRNNRDAHRHLGMRSLRHFRAAVYLADEPAGMRRSVAAPCARRVLIYILLFSTFQWNERACFQRGD